MIRNLPLLRDQIVFLEVADNRHVGMNAQRYLAVARSVRATLERELGGVAIEAFAVTRLPTLQTTAENIYFETYGCFADLDGSGRAAVAHALADDLIERARAR